MVLLRTPSSSSGKEVIFYKNIWLTKNSEAYELHQKGEFVKLDKLLKETAKKHKELLERYK